MVVSSRTGVISTICKKADKEDISNNRPSHSSLDATIFLFLDITYITLHNGNFGNLKKNQLLSKKGLHYAHFLIFVI